METTFKKREGADARVKPPFLSLRYYYLRQLAKAMRSVVTQLSEKDDKHIVVDYGCGDMPYKALFSEISSQYIGVDIAENPLADSYIELDGKMTLADSSCDIVLSTQVLEHVEDPEYYLKEANRVLRKDGLLVLSTHGYWMYHPDPSDYWRWTSSGLQKIVNRNGYEIVRFDGILSRSSMGLQLFQDGLVFKFPKFLRPVIGWILQPFIILFDKISSESARKNDACTYILVAKKI